MSTYQAPVEDVLFLLNDVFHIERYDNLPGFAEASPDLVSWLPIWTNTFTGPFSDPQSNVSSNRFYRAHVP